MTNKHEMCRIWLKDIITRRHKDGYQDGTLYYCMGCAAYFPAELCLKYRCPCCHYRIRTRRRHWG